MMTADGTMERLANIDYIRQAHGYLVWANIKWLCPDGQWVVPYAPLVQRRHKRVNLLGLACYRLTLKAYAQIIVIRKMFLNTILYKTLSILEAF
jgi:hypothetical protein